MFYFSEMAISPVLAVVLFARSTLSMPAAITLFAAGCLVWTLSEYMFHRFVLHDFVHGHRVHHADPGEPVTRIFWQIWLCFAIVYVILGGVFLSGALVTYSWYLFVHHCVHHRPDRIPTTLLRHHNVHHRLARRNFGVSTRLWDRVFKTRAG